MSGFLEAYLNSTPNIVTIRRAVDFRVAEFERAFRLGGNPDLRNYLTLGSTPEILGYFGADSQGTFRRVPQTEDIAGSDSQPSVVSDTCEQVDSSAEIEMKFM
jgi:hypothetical protein